MQVILFPKNNHAKLTTRQDTYAIQQFSPPIEFNERPADYFEGDKTHVFYIPEIPENPLDKFNDQLVLFQALFHEGKKVYRWFKSFFNVNPNPSPFEESVNTSITKATKILWEESLDNMEKQLIDLNKFTQEKHDLRWVKYILEDRQEEFNSLNQLSEINLTIANAFTENLYALQTELKEISKNLDLTINKQDKNFKQRTNNTDILSCKSLEHRYLPLPKKSNVLTAGGFFNAPFCKENTRRLGCDSSSRNFCINKSFS